MKESQNKLRRIPVGVLAVILLITGGAMYVVYPNYNPLMAGMFVRIGALLAVIWLAFPQLMVLRDRIPTFLIGTILLGMAFVAARPKIGSVVFSIMMLAISVGAVLKWLSKIAANDPKRRGRKPTGANRPKADPHD